MTKRKVAKKNVVDVSIHVTCLEEDADAVSHSLNEWYCNHDVAMVQRQEIGGIGEGEPKPIEAWMDEVLCPWVKEEVK